MHPRGSIYNPPNGKWRVESERFQGKWKAKSQFIWDSMRKNLKTFVFMHISRYTWFLAQNMRVHADIALKVAYTNKQVFFGDFLGHQSIILEKGGPRSLQRDT